MDLLSHVKHQIAHIDTKHPITVALSGGVDSMVLLHILNQIGSHTINAVHIHHGLQSINDQMQAHCEMFCKQHQIDLKTVPIQLPKTGNIENEARTARYQVFSKLDTQHVCLAHHKNDVYETLIMRLYQGRLYSLPYAMPSSRMKGHQNYFRPMLAIPKTTIIAYALKHKLPWVEDPSNHSAPFLRNRIRKLSTLNLELDTIGHLLHRFSKTVVKFENSLIRNILPAIHCKETFDIQAPYVHPYLFRLWLLKHTHIQISEEKARYILTHFQSAKIDAQPEYKIEHVYLRRFKTKVFLTPKTIDRTGTIYHDHSYTLAFRNQVNGHGHFLKRLFQQKRVPHIYRNHMPIVLKNNEIIAVWGLYLHPHRHIQTLYWNNPPEFIENYPFPLLKEDLFQYTKPENIKDSYAQFNC